MGQLAEIRVIYTYAHTQSERQKEIVKVNTPKQSQTDVKKTLRISLDGEKHIKLILSEVAKQPPEDKTIEKVEDHNFEFNSLEQCSITAQINNLKIKFCIKNKNELMSKPNPRVFDLPTAQYIMQILLEQAENSNSYLCFFIFSPLSLTHYKDLPVFQKFTSQYENKEVSLRNPKKKCFFKQSFEVSKFKDFVLRKHRLNSVNSFTIPLALKYYLENLSQLKKMMVLRLIPRYRSIYKKLIKRADLPVNNTKSSMFNQ